MKKVVLSAGHSFNDPGAVNRDPDFKESFLTIEITNLITPLLKAHGVRVDTIPDELSLQETIDLINKDYKDHDVAIEIHINAGGGEGIEGWYFQNSEVSKKLVNDILNGIVSETGMKSRGAKDETTNRWGRLGFIHDTKPLACLIECGFIDSQVDLKLLSTEEGRYKIAKGIARGICSFLEVTWDDSKLPKDAGDACQVALAASVETAANNKQKWDEWLGKANDRKKEFEKFKKEEYQRAVDLCNDLEGKLNNERIDHAGTKKNIVKPLQDQLNDLNEVKIPKLEKVAEDADSEVKKANIKITKLLDQEFTVAEALHFMFKAIKGGDWYDD